MMSNRYLTKLLLSAHVKAVLHKECSFVHVRAGERAAAREPSTTFVVHVLKQDIYELSSRDVFFSFTPFSASYTSAS